MDVIGYIRVSTEDQEVQQQISKLWGVVTTLRSDLDRLLLEVG
jgi:DNA invertase Pin-like site-specific DNA recombinase